MVWNTGDVIAIAVAVAASFTTIVAVLISASTARTARLSERRYDAYLRIYEIVAQITAAASNHSIFPGVAGLDQDPDRDLERHANIEMLLVGSGPARAAYLEWRTAVHAYWPLVFNAASGRAKYDRLVAAKEGGDDIGPSQSGTSPMELALYEAEQQRMKLFSPMTRIDEAAAKLEVVLRGEIL